eukprot:jgi/Chlat1/9289/Chrsp99S00717
MAGGRVAAAASAELMALDGAIADDDGRSAKRRAYLAEVKAAAKLKTEVFREEQAEVRPVVSYDDVVETPEAAAHARVDEQEEQEAQEEAAAPPVTTAELLDEVIKDAKRRDKPPAATSNASQKRKRAAPFNKHAFIKGACAALKEPKVAMMYKALDRLRHEAMRQLLTEVAAVETAGGQMTADNARRRTPGGVFWNLLKMRVRPEVYKEITTPDKEVQRERERKKAQRRRNAKKRQQQQSAEADKKNGVTTHTTARDVEGEEIGDSE